MLNRFIRPSASVRFKPQLYQKTGACWSCRNKSRYWGLQTSRNSSALPERTNDGLEDGRVRVWTLQCASLALCLQENLENVLMLHCIHSYVEITLLYGILILEPVKFKWVKLNCILNKPDHGIPSRLNLISTGFKHQQDHDSKQTSKQRLFDQETGIWSLEVSVGCLWSIMEVTAWAQKITVSQQMQVSAKEIPSVTHDAETSPPCRG